MSNVIARRCRSHREKIERKRDRRHHAACLALNEALAPAMKWIEENCLVSSTTIMSDGQGGLQIEHYENKDLLKDKP